jgi:hypothetical protein
MAVTVLSAARDPLLLRMRNEVLARAGCDVTPADSSAQLVNRFFDGDHDAIVLCHSIPPEEIRKVLRMVKTYRPSMCAILVSPLAADPLVQDIPVFLDVRSVSCEPEALIRALADAFPRHAHSA